MEAATQTNPQSETFEQFMAGMKELREEFRAQVKETDRLIQENARRQEETDRQMKETDRRMKETELRFKETERLFEKTEKVVMENSRQMGLLSNSFGELTEHLVAPGILGKFKNLGFAVEKTSQNIIIENHDNSKIVTEIDVLLENGDAAIVVEVKSKLRDKHLEEFLVKMEKLRQYADRKQDKRKYIGAIASAIVTNEQRGKILDEGIYVIEQSGDTMKINAPDGFKPREW